MRMRSLTLLGAVLVTLPAMAAEGDFKAMFVKHWQIAKEFTLAVAEAMPTESYNFKPNPEEQTFGQLMIHIASQNSDSCASATGTKPPPSIPSSDAMPPEQWNMEVYKFKGQPVLASEALWYTFTHMAHHRGQAEVYLRMKNIKPPAWRF